MKKLALIIIFTFAACIAAFAQQTIGSFVMLPNSKLKGSYYKPQMALTKIQNSYFITVRCTCSNTYESFDSESVVLLKFDDESVEKLHISPLVEVSKKYSNTAIGSTIVDFYSTYSTYELSEECLKKIINKQQIKKVRLSFTNGNVKDYDITPNYMEKMAEKLYESYLIVESTDTSRKSVIQDVETGF